MATTRIPFEGKTCTVHVGVGVLCGGPAVVGVRLPRGTEIFECAEHRAPEAEPAAPVKTGRVKCRTCGHVHTFGPCGIPVGPGKREACGCTVF